MIRNITLLGGDARQQYLAQTLLRDGFSVSCCEVPGMSDSGDLHAALAQTQAVILPMPALTRSGAIRSALSSGISLEAALQCLPPGTPLFGGGLSAAQPLLSQYPVQVYDYCNDEALTIANAAISAEGALRVALQELPITLCGSRCLVIGYGRIGKCLAARLYALGAAVTVSARNPADRAAIEAAGLRADTTGSYLHGLSAYDCIFNTVPATVLRTEHLHALRSDCRIIDLASGAGALEVDAPPQLHYIHALGLPGTDAPASAAQVLRNFIVRTLAEQEVL